MVILCAKEIAARLGISARSAVRLMKSGDIKSFRAGRKPWRTTELHLESYVQSALLRETERLAEERCPILKPLVERRRVG